jgi:hypothetical protein
MAPRHHGSEISSPIGKASRVPFQDFGYSVCRKRLLVSGLCVLAEVGCERWVGAIRSDL